MDKKSVVSSSSIKLLHSVDTLYTADSVEWCSINGFRDVLLCGTYQLKSTASVKSSDENEESEHRGTDRVGRLLAFRLKNSSASSTENETSLVAAAPIDMPAILDVKWSHCNVKGDQPIFAVADAFGAVTIWQLKMLLKLETQEPVCELQETVDIENAGLVLSLDWSNAIERSDTKIVSSCSDGSLALLAVDTEGTRSISRWRAHDYEAWIAAFDYHNTSIIYSGGDDCKFKIWDTRTSLSSPTKILNEHSMGVCSIQSNALHEHIVATGSYDERVCMWDTRHLHRPLSSTALGGGVWRLKWDKAGVRLLCVCMHNGVHILDCTDTNLESLPIVASYMDHNALVYGGDWCKSQLHSKPSSDPEGPETIVASCSFYEHALHIWTL